MKNGQSAASCRVVLASSFLTVAFRHAYNQMRGKLMQHPFFKFGESTFDHQAVANCERGGPSFRDLRSAVRLAGWLTLPAALLLAVGCGGGSDKKQKAVAVAESSGDDDDKEAPSQEAAPAPKKKAKVVVQAEEPEPAPPAVHDINKWDLAQLNAALNRRDPQFAMAAILFSARDAADAKRAADLDSLLQKVAKIKDDASIPLALPPGAFTGGDKSPVAAPGAPGQAQPPGGLMPGRRRMIRPGHKF